MEANPRFARMTFLACVILSVLLGAVAAFLFFQSPDGDKSRLLVADRYVCWGILPSFISLFLALKYPDMVSPRFRLLPILPAVVLFSLFLAIYTKLWL